MTAAGRRALENYLGHMERVIKAARGGHLLGEADDLALLEGGVEKAAKEVLRRHSARAASMGAVDGSSPPVRQRGSGRLCRPPGR